MNDGKRKQVVSRRATLGLLAGASALFAFGCGDDEGSDDELGSDGGTDGTSGDGGTTDASSTLDASTQSGDAGSCTPTPEGEIGPYFADDSDVRFNRTNILSNLDGSSTQTGVPLTLTVFVLDAQAGCQPYANAQVDIWHCNSSGVYSDQASENTTTEQWLRGYQITDANGKVAFTTIVPGWYAGRTKHIHLRIRSSYSNASSTSDGTNTTQLFFPQTVDDNLDVNIYKEGKNPTTNDSDRVYSDQENGANVLTLSGDTTNGYVAAVTIFLPITASASSSTDNGGPGGPDGGMPNGGPPDGAMPNGGPPGMQDAG